MQLVYIMAYQEKDIKRILDAYLAGKATPGEKRLLDQFFNEHREEVSKEHLNPKEYQLLEQQIRGNIEKSIRPRRTTYPYLSLAAAVSAIAIISFAFFYFRASSPVLPAAKPIAFITKGNQRGQKSTISLPDGSIVRLNANSSITFPEQFTGKTREVSLQGEAWFEVKHNPSRPFIVSTGKAKTTVLGTTFNVRSISQHTVITLVTGKVEVREDSHDVKVRLKPGQQAVIEEGSDKIDTASVNVNRFIEWKDNILAFRETPLSEAVTTLEDWYGVDIELGNKDLAACRITGRYEEESLENVLESLRFMLKGKYVIEGRKVILSGKGCRF